MKSTKKATTQTPEMYQKALCNVLSKLNKIGKVYMTEKREKFGPEHILTFEVFIENIDLHEQNLADMPVIGIIRNYLDVPHQIRNIIEPLFKGQKETYRQQGDDGIRIRCGFDHLGNTSFEYDDNCSTMRYRFNISHPYTQCTSQKLEWGDTLYEGCSETLRQIAKTVTEKKLAVNLDQLTEEESEERLNEVLKKSAQLRQYVAGIETIIEEAERFGKVCFIEYPALGNDGYGAAIYVDISNKTPEAEQNMFAAITQTCLAPLAEKLSKISYLEPGRVDPVPIHAKGFLPINANKLQKESSLVYIMAVEQLSCYQDKFRIDAKAVIERVVRKGKLSELNPANFG